MDSQKSVPTSPDDTLTHQLPQGGKGQSDSHVLDHPGTEPLQASTDCSVKELDAAEKFFDDGHVLLEDSDDGEPVELIPAEWDVEDFSPEWWNLVRSCPLFRDYWMQGYAEDENSVSPEVSFEDDEEYYDDHWAKVTVQGQSTEALKTGKKSEEEEPDINVLPCAKGKSVELVRKMEALEVQESGTIADQSSQITIDGHSSNASTDGPTVC